MDTAIFLLITGVFCGESRLQSDKAVSWNEIIEQWNKRKSNFEYGVGAKDPDQDIFTYTQVRIETSLTPIL